MKQNHDDRFDLVRLSSVDLIGKTSTVQKAIRTAINPKDSNMTIIEAPVDCKGNSFGWSGF